MVFGLHNDTRPIACSGCKTEGMIDIKNKKCKCGKRMYFGLPDDKRASACNGCKTEGMIDIKNKKCKCGTRMYFGLPDDKRASACSKCKTEGMVNIVDKKCKCGKIMYYGLPADTRPRACNGCKTEGMIDIKSKKCTCGKRMVFGLHNDKRASACNGCKTEGMIDIVNKKCKCRKQMYFGLPNDTRPSACNGCKTEGMIDIKNKKCISCNLFRVSHSTKFLCSYCRPNSSKKQHTKERKVVNFLNDEKEIPKFTHNKSIGQVCGNFRPDISIDCVRFFLVVEIDENQHSAYPQECEITRMYNIEQALGLRTHFIRYNPDAYKVNGLTTRVDTTKRLQHLSTLIQHYLESPPLFEDDILSVEYLYYDTK